MKTIICTTPIRPVPTDYPPLGSMAVIQSLRSAGYDPAFFDIDGLRPSFDEVIAHFKKERPDVIAVSAVVSTAYGYVKKLCLALREILPEAKIILGGNLAASAELLHRQCGIDVCVIGEGEKPAVNLMRYYEDHFAQHDYDALKQIKGLSYLDAAGELVFTGYESPIPAAELFDPDYSILEKYSDITHFIYDPFSRRDFSEDPRSYQAHREGKKMGQVIFTKGCVARCTFCHRWDRGFRQLSPDRVIKRIQYLMDRYNVGFIQFGDENFGSDRRATEELIRLIKPLDILWVVGGVRARSVDADLLKRMYDAGCSGVYYGFETGSPSILKVMEKNLELHHNIDAARWTYDAGVYTCYQLVLGMPGETHQTIGETIDMVKQITEFLPEPPYNYLSINYIQALPGTPVYEYARSTGLIDASVGEEEYLERISDINAADDTKFLNFTEYPYLVCRSWRPRLLYEVSMHWYRKGTKRTSRPERSRIGRRYESGGYFNLHDIVAVNPFLLRVFYPIRAVPIWAWTIASEFRRSPFKVFCRRILDLLTWSVKPRKQGLRDYRSLRLIMKDLAPPPNTPSEQSMQPMRLGR
jgi:anaerobic magnesium-protoporphyrin IX monomethyl ester cyclase